MNDGKPQVTETELHQFIDGELDEARSREIALIVAGDPALGKTIERYRHINRRLADFYDDGLSAPVPSRLLVALSGSGGKRAWRAAAALAWMLVGGLIGYLLHGPADTVAFVRPLPVEAAYAHAVYVPEIRHPVEVDASQQEHLNAWLSKRLDRPIAAPDLRGAGYALIGGRLLPDGHRAAAQFMYEDDSGERVTLYIRNAGNARETALTHAEKEGLGIVYWIDGGLAYALTAKADREALTGAAKLVYREVNP
jgi:anti-sigma factor RsiW